ncbi:peptide ABC transporter substrate-binding protein [Secundilactobacillus paracollinoides]|uniref:peptide ABC transporter substrate-binding protein n=1 Tax=Secundilactobacillus paracollinoides TaxID=240427 RepID=UPI0006D03D35|nr:peptide ABC transporter substrate-binding protein [Secundilactobacillus paracollinoides]KRL78655.1 ABC transporter periplasmic protein [Secundilactobacillus paracollinoides DSM 15502 = JCM 11969]
MVKKTKLLATLMVAGAAVLLAACGKQSSTSNKQVLNLSMSAPIGSLDISKSTDFSQTGNVYESFYRLGKNGKVTPGLAKSGTVSKDGKTWTFKLRNAKWSNGTPITAKDFVYSWRRTVNPDTKSQYAYLFSSIKNATKINAGNANPDTLGIKAEGKHTVVVSLTKPVAYFKVLMTYSLFAPQSQKVVDKYGKKYATKSQYNVYSGPFKVKDWTGTGNKWSFVKNNDYWDKKVVKLSKINYQIVSSNSTGLDLYQQNKLDLTPLSSEQVKNYQNNKAFKQYAFAYITYLKYNFKDPNKTRRAAINNRNIRLAISLAIDRNQLTKKVLGDGSTTPTGFVTSGLASDPKTGKDFGQEQKVKDRVVYDKKMAQYYWKKGMKQLGMKKLTLSVIAASDVTASSPLTQYLKAQLQSVLPGFTLNLQLVPQQIADSDGKKGQFDMTVSSWGADFKDPITFLQIPETGTSYNYGKYSNKAYDALIKKSENQDANNKEARWNDLVKASRLFTKDQGMTPLYQQTTSYLQNPKVKGIIHNTAGEEWNFKSTYLK